MHYGAVNDAWLLLLLQLLLHRHQFEAAVNPAELEYISDELSERDCFRLLRALKDSNWFLNLTRLDEVRTLSSLMRL